MGAAKIRDISCSSAEVVSMDLDLGQGNLHSDFTSPADMQGVSALVLVGGKPEAERFAEFPLALLDVLGRSVLMRTVDRLQADGINQISILSDTDPLPLRMSSASCKFSTAAPESFWGEALQQYRKLSHQSEYVLVVRLGAWAEVDFAAMVQKHRRMGSSVMRACSRLGGELDIFVISSSSQSEAAALLRGELCDERIAPAEFKTSAYVNLLNTPDDLRLLTLDAFAGESEIRPVGRELRPGVWIGKGARIHPRARIVAPAFIGDFCNVRRSAIVTRGSSLEHHSEVDCATVIDNSNVLPYTRIGAGLDVEYSVAGFHHVHSLQRKASVGIEDPHLIGVTTTYLSARMFTAASWLVTFLPNVLWKVFFEPKPEQMESKPPAPSTPALDDAPLAAAESQTQSYSEMAATRRYGNQ
jgi:carbonic anhydrase/acetyltransferase-like protein (isoleucine patch superfamily)